MVEEALIKGECGGGKVCKWLCRFWAAIVSDSRPYYEVVLGSIFAFLECLEFLDCFAFYMNYTSFSCFENKLTDMYLMKLIENFLLTSVVSGLGLRKYWN